MATFRNDTGDDLTIDRFGLYVPAGLTFEIPDEDADSLAGQSALVRVATDPQIGLPAEIVRTLTPDVDDEPAPAPADPVPDAAPDVPPAAADAAPAAPAGTPAPAAAPTPAPAEADDVDAFHL